jgi:hypothetical protein
VEDKVIDYAIALESLFSKEGDTIDSLAHKYSLRCARLLKADPRERKKVFCQMKHFYIVRSNIVHGNSKEKSLTKISLPEIENNIRKSIQLFIEKLNGQSQEDIIDYLDYG